MTDDETGEETIKILKRTLKVAQLINSNHPSSLGLHSVVYFYSKDGRHKTAQFYGIVQFVIDIDKKKKKNEFTKSRQSLEYIIWNYDYLIQQINRKYRSASNSFTHIANFLYDCVLLLNEGLAIENVIQELIKKQYNYLTIENETHNNEIISTDFTTNKKSAVYIMDAIDTAPRCKICGGLIHRNSISIDHRERKEDGGKASIENGQLTHPYCNTGFKN